MTLQEILKAKGMSVEDIESTIGEMKQNKIFTSSEENIDIRYNDLKGKHETLTKQHNENNALIEKYKQEAEQSATLQQTIEQLKAENETLKKQYSDLQEDVAMDRVLLAGGAKPDSLDYLKFHWRKTGEIALDENGNVKGGVDTVSSLKTQLPPHFDGGVNNRKVLGDNRLPEGKNDTVTITRAQFLKMGYEERLALKAENEALYNKLNNQK